VPSSQFDKILFDNPAPLKICNPWRNKHEVKRYATKYEQEETLMEQDYSKVDAILASYRGKKGILIPMLQEVQNEMGYLSRDCMKHVAEAMQIPAAEIFGVATFYSMFRLKPQGKHIVRVCKGTACHVSDADGIKTALVEALKLPKDENTTSDMMFTLM
jgi:NADH-quinone oxidoreductase subunit E